MIEYTKFVKFKIVNVSSPSDAYMVCILWFSNPLFWFRIIAEKGRIWIGRNLQQKHQDNFDIEWMKKQHKGEKRKKWTHNDTNIHKTKLIVLLHFVCLMMHTWKSCLIFAFFEPKIKEEEKNSDLATNRVPNQDRNASFVYRYSYMYLHTAAAALKRTSFIIFHVYYENARRLQKNAQSSEYMILWWISDFWSLFALWFLLLKFFHLHLFPLAPVYEFAVVGVCVCVYEWFFFPFLKTIQRIQFCVNNLCQINGWIYFENVEDKETYKKTTNQPSLQFARYLLIIWLWNWIIRSDSVG